jgi:hypothetical protein
MLESIVIIKYIPPEKPKPDCIEKEAKEGLDQIIVSTPYVLANPISIKILTAIIARICYSAMSRWR